MRMSEFLRRKTLQIAGGVILNYFKIKKRRDTLYFGDIPAKYFLLCEKNGFAEELQKIGQKWMYLYFSILLPDALKKIQPEDLLNNIIKKVWINMGLMSEYEITKDGKNVTIKTKDEGMTEITGKNSFLTGFHEGILNALHGKEVEVLSAKQGRKECQYNFKILDNKFSIEGKSKNDYNKLNHMPPVKGLTLHDMLKKNVFSLKDQKLYFRGKVLYPIENTAIHLFSNRGLMLDKVPKISYEFFREVLDKSSSDEYKLRLLKNLLQAMGWGAFNITKSNDGIRIKIDNPPYGLQKERDNWDFLVKMIEGYVENIDKNYRMVGFKEGYKTLAIGFSI